jgi:hypothetical protein
MVPKQLRFKDLKELGIVNNWPQLGNLVDNEGFPPGRLLSPNVRAWNEDQILAWLESRPVGMVKPLRGAAKIRHEAAEAAA